MLIYPLTLIILVVIDGIWLGLIAGRLYASQLGPLMADPIRWGPAIAFYLIYSAGLVLFVIQPAMDNGGWPRALLMGAAFGLVAYATYDLTCLSVIRGYPTTIALIDMAWGTTASAVTAALAVIVAQRWLQTGIST